MVQSNSRPVYLRPLENLIVAWYGCDPSSGVGDGCKGNRKLFSRKVLYSPKEYIHVSQKLLKGAAARAMLFWLAPILYKVAVASELEHDVQLDHLKR